MFTVAKQADWEIAEQHAQVKKLNIRVYQRCGNV